MRNRLSAPASFTLEAAIITAITMFVMCTAVLLSFNVHDKVIMSADGEAAIIGNVPGRNEKQQKEAAGIMTEAARSMMETDMIMTDLISVNTEGSEGAYTVTANGSFSWVLAPVMGYIGECSDSPAAGITVSDLDGRKILLKYKLAADLLKKVTE